jgi:hypothetical protein
MKQVYKGEKICQGSYKSGAKKNQPCDRPGYFMAGGQVLCGTHSKGMDRVELDENPHKSQVNKAANDHREERVVEFMTRNMNQGLKSQVVVTKLYGRKNPEHRDGFMSVFPNNKHGDRTDGLGMNTLSPMRMGPIVHFIPDAPIAKTLEDFWQSSKMYKCESQDGEPTEEYVRTRNAGFQNDKPQRHKKVRDFESGVVCSIWYDDQGQVHKLGYVESRQVYCAIYEHFARQSPQFAELVEARDNGMNLNIIGYDGHDVERYPGDTLEAKFEAAYLDPQLPFGHEMCLQALLILEPSQLPWRKHTTINVFKH